MTVDHDRRLPSRSAHRTSRARCPCGDGTNRFVAIRGAANHTIKNLCLRITFSQTAVASRQYRTDRQLLWRRAMERALYIEPILNLSRLSRVRAPVWRLLAAVAAVRKQRPTTNRTNRFALSTLPKRTRLPNPSCIGLRATKRSPELR